MKREYQKMRIRVLNKKEFWKPESYHYVFWSFERKRQIGQKD